jgi:hypothetical protein
MAYPKKAKQENSNSDNTVTAPTAPQAPSVSSPQVVGASGGAPRIAANPPPPIGDPGIVATIPPYQNRATNVQAANSMRQLWGQTGTPNAYDRTFQRQMGADPGVVAGSMSQYWQGESAGNNQNPMPAPSSMPLPEAQKYLADLSKSMKAQLDAKFKSLSPEEASRSRFWNMYKQFPEGASLMAARRHWTNQMVGSGPVADWLQWLKKG